MKSTDIIIIFGIIYALSGSYVEWFYRKAYTDPKGIWYNAFTPRIEKIFRIIDLVFIYCPIINFSMAIVLFTKYGLPYKKSQKPNQNGK